MAPCTGLYASDMFVRDVYGCLFWALSVPCNSRTVTRAEDCGISETRRIGDGYHKHYKWDFRLRSEGELVCFRISHLINLIW